MPSNIWVSRNVESRRAKTGSPYGQLPSPVPSRACPLTQAQVKALLGEQG
ncbi:hypothetical protein [Xanthomonas graminis]|nr:hypothetical protein [Xanthomonas translucens]UKE66137.1 hypothetical protein KM547_02025 [Xanthomonas translucens pv. phlei]